MVAAATRYRPLDARTLFVEAQTLTADDFVTDGVTDPTVIDFGAGRIDGSWVMDVSAIAIDGNDELYSFHLEGSNVSDFASGVELLASMHLGATEVRPGGAIDSTIGRYAKDFSNEVNGVEYRYARIRLITAGSTKSITIDTWLSIQSN